MTRVFIRATALAFLSLPLLGAAPARAAALTPGRHVLDGPEVWIHNLAGEMRIIEGTGSSVVVEVTAAGRDKDRLTVDVRKSAKGPVLYVVYPETRVVYGEGYPPGNRSSLDYDGRRYTVVSRGSGLDAHADVTIRVPRDKIVHARDAVGNGFITGVSGAVSFEGASSTVQAERVTGSLAVDVGSGNVSITRSHASISADTGSGNVSLTEVDGDVSVDAGSGDIEMNSVNGGKIAIDAGSGRITGSDVRAASMSADCGSGEIDLTGASVGRMAVEAGSGSVRLGLARNVDQLSVSAGSGSVKLEAPRDLSARFTIECPRRNLHIGFPADIDRGDDDTTEGTIGSGRGTIHIEAGSGSVELVRM